MSEDEIDDDLNLAPEGSHVFAFLADGRPIVAAWRREVRSQGSGWMRKACYVWTLSIEGQPFVALRGTTAEPGDLSLAQRYLAKQNPGLCAVKQPNGHEHIAFSVYRAHHYGSVSGSVILDFDLASRIVRCHDELKADLD